MCEGMDVRNVVVQERWYWARLNIAVLVVRRREISASVRGTASATLSEMAWGRDSLRAQEGAIPR
jgi:hypothetical protein